MFGVSAMSTSSSEKIGALPSQAEHLAESQAAECSEQHEGSVRLVDLVGELPDVVGVEESHLATLDSRERELGDGVVGNQAVLEGGVHALVHELHHAVDGGGCEVAALGRPEVGHPGAKCGSVELAERGRSEHGAGVRSKELLVSGLRARAQIRDRRPPLVPPLTDGDATESWIDEGPVLAVDLGHVGEREGVAAALELLRTLLAVSGAESHR